MTRYSEHYDIGDVLQSGLTSVETISLDASRLEQLAKQYAAVRFAPIPVLLYPDHARTLLATTANVPARRVQCGNRHVAWDEQSFDPGHPAYQFFEQPGLVELAQTLTGRKAMTGLTCWTSGYRSGEYINPHRDRAGTIQLLVCLQAPRSPQNGGTLIVDGNELFLSPGQAIAFDATSLEHYTTPLTPSEDEPDPQRVVLVGRYFLEYPNAQT